MGLFSQLMRLPTHALVGTQTVYQQHIKGVPTSGLSTTDALDAITELSPPALGADALA